MLCEDRVALPLTWNFWVPRPRWISRAGFLVRWSWSGFPFQTRKRLGFGSHGSCSPILIRSFNSKAALENHQGRCTQSSKLFKAKATRQQPRGLARRYDALIEHAVWGIFPATYFATIEMMSRKGTAVPCPYHCGDTSLKLRSILICPM